MSSIFSKHGGAFHYLATLLLNIPMPGEQTFHIFCIKHQ